MPRPQRHSPPYDEQAVLALLTRQAGVVSRGQLAGLGVTPADLRRFVRRRLLLRLSPGVFVETTTALSPLQRAWWACLHYGHAAVADRSAVELARDATGRHLTLPIHVAVAAGRAPGPLSGVEVHQVRRLDRLVAWHGRPPRMHAAPAVLRAASRTPSNDELVSTLTDAVTWRVAGAARLESALCDLPALPRRRLIREVLGDLRTGTHSILEREYLRRVERAHGLPTGQRQAPRQTSHGREFRDVSYDAHGLVVELDGRAFHSGKRAWDADLERDLDELVSSRHTARLGWRQVLGTPCRTAAKVGELLRQRGWSGRPRRCGPDCALPG